MTKKSKQHQKIGIMKATVKFYENDQVVKSENFKTKSEEKKVINQKLDFYDKKLKSFRDEKGLTSYHIRCSQKYIDIKDSFNFWFFKSLNLKNI